MHRKCAALVISINREQKAFCGLFFPAPWPLPLPQLPWQQENEESTQEQRLKPGGRPITCPQRAGPVHSSPPALQPFVNRHRLLLQPGGKCSSRTALLPAWFHCASSSPSAPAPPCSPQWECQSGAGATGAMEGSGLLILFPC